MREEFEEPRVEIVAFDETDVIETSGCDQGGPYELGEQDFL